MARRDMDRKQPSSRISEDGACALSGISGASNGSHAKLCGQGPRAEARAARRLPRTTFAEPSRDLQPP
jgi:hypothetical protein